MRFLPVLPLTLLLLTLLPAGSLSAQIVYDARRGTAPDAQGWTFFATGGQQTPPKKSGAVAFSTEGHLGYQGGYSRLLSFKLSRAKGYALAFDLQVRAEAHKSPNRSGVSLIVLGADKKGLELAFWTDQIWAQTDMPLFTHGEQAAFNTTAKLVHYALDVQGSRYQLSADGKRILSGRVRDYTAFEGFINPYRTPNFLFLGDDSTSASGSFRLARFAVSRQK